VSDVNAALLAGALVVIAVASYQHREVLQPTRTGAALYLAGTVAWGVALMLLWAAWAAGAPAEVCAEGGCESLAGTLENAEIPTDFLTGHEPLGDILTE
jgi:hypothetical protein